jgi:hypothetical protein
MTNTKQTDGGSSAIDRPRLERAIAIDRARGQAIQAAITWRFMLKSPELGAASAECKADLIRAIDRLVDLAAE